MGGNAVGEGDVAHGTSAVAVGGVEENGSSDGSIVDARVRELHETISTRMRKPKSNLQ